MRAHDVGLLRRICASPLSCWRLPFVTLALSTSHLTLQAHTRHLLLLVTGHGADDGVLLASEAVHTALDVGFGLGSLDLCLTGGMLLAARVGPGGRAGHVANRLDDCTL